MIEKIELERTEHMYTYQIQPSTTEVAQTVNKLIDYVQELEDKIAELSAPKNIPVSGPNQSDTVVKKRGRVPGKETA